ncbi:MAG: NAD(P)-dependent alcohol dehydrogenase [Myxococcota bacterium]
MTALQGLRDELGVRPGHRVLLNGASGGVGTLAVQIAKALDAEVIAVCSHRNVDRMHELGADRVVDYEKKDPASLRNLDAVFDIYGSLPWPRARASLRRNGRYCTTIPKLGNIARGMGRKVGLHRAALVVVKSRRSDLALLARWVNEGKLRPVIDRVLPLSQCADGHRRLESRRTQGKVVIEIGAA